MAEKRKDLAAHYHIDNEDGMKNLITRVFKRGDAERGCRTGRSRQVRDIPFSLRAVTDVTGLCQENRPSRNDPAYLTGR